MALCDAKYLIKINLVGDAEVRNHPLFLELVGTCTTTCSPSSSSTPKISVCNVQVDNAATQITVWNIAAEERYKNITNIVFHRTMGIALVYDATCRDSFARLGSYYYADALQRCELRPKVIVLAVNWDVAGKGGASVSLEEGRSFARSIAANFFPLAATVDANYAAAFVQLASEVLRDPELAAAASTLGGRAALTLAGENVNADRRKKSC